MNSLPLHPLMVHLPLGLAILMPFIAIGFAWALWTGRVRTRAWVAVVALQAVLVGSGLLAINSGAAEEDRVEAVVREAAIQRHEEFAEQFVWAGGLTLGVAVLVLMVRRPTVSGMLAATAVVGTLVVAGLGVRAGHAGGQLVYVHGAAAAYTSVTRVPSEKTPTTPPTQEDDDHPRRGAAGVPSNREGR